MRFQPHSLLVLALPFWSSFPTFTQGSDVCVGVPQKECKKKKQNKKKVCIFGKKKDKKKSCYFVKKKPPKVDKVCADYVNFDECMFIGLTPCAWDYLSNTCRHVCTTHEDAKTCKEFDIKEKKVCKWDKINESCDVKKPKPPDTPPKVDKVCADYDNLKDCLFIGLTPCAWDDPSGTCRHVCYSLEDSKTCNNFDIEEKKVCEWDNADKSCVVKKPEPEVDLDCADYDNSDDCLFMGLTSCSWDIPSATCRHVCYSLEDAKTCKKFDIEGKRVCKFGKALNPCAGCRLKTECKTES